MYYCKERIVIVKITGVLVVVHTFYSCLKLTFVENILCCAIYLFSSAPESEKNSMSGRFILALSCNFL
jgi:hypothetical protein